jgi:RNA polymerase sigma-70 factor (ECF subfamily)
LAEVDTLPDAYREVILLYYYDDVTYQDVAAALGVSAATVNARLTKARAMLRERLSGMQR